MNRNRLMIVTAMTAIIAIVAFFSAAFVYNRSIDQTAISEAERAGDIMVRPYSPILGPKDAPVTIVEFFDPSCEACRAFYPIVKKIMEIFPEDVRVVLRYAPLHKGSDEAVRILEAARRQDKFEPVLEAILEKQPAWAVDGAPNLEEAWNIAQAAGLVLVRAKSDANLPEITAVLEQEMADLKAMKVQRTPTFFVNGKPLTSFGPQQLFDLVNGEVQATRALSQ